jgi:hypothetical protein
VSNVSQQVSLTATPVRRERSVFFWTAIVALAGLVIIGGLVIFSAVGQFTWSAKQHWVQVAMMADRPIRDVTITVSGKRYILGPIGAHTGQSIRYDIAAASDFQIQGTFADGTPFGGRCGHVTPATPPGTVTIVVNDTGTLSYSDAVRP